MKWSNSFLLFVGGGLTLFFPYLILGQDTAIPLADQLDSNHVWYVLLKEHQAFLASPFSEIEGFLGTQYRLSYPAGISIISSLYFLFTPFFAFFLNKILIYTLGFWGMWLLLTDRFRFTESLAAACALIWASSYFYPFMGAGIAALPAIGYAFHRILTRKFAWQNWLIIVVYPFYSELVLVTMFVWIIVVGVGVADFFYYKKWNPIFFASLALMLFLMMLKDYQLILAFFTPSDFVSHRTEFVFDGYLVNKTIDPILTLAQGEYTGMMYFQGLFGFTLLLLAFNLRKANTKLAPYAFFLLAILIALTSSFLSLPQIPQSVALIFSSLASLSLGRISNLVSLGLFLAFFTASREIPISYRNLIFGFVLFFQIGLANYEWKSLLKKLIPPKQEWSYNPSYREIYSADAFEKLKKHLPQDYQGYIGHVNLPPAISAYNGLKTIDGYLANYQLESKHQIQKVIGDELEKDPHIRDLFYFWGNKAYFFNASHQEWVYPFRQMFNSKIAQLDYNWNFLKTNLNTHYIISAGEVMDPNLQLIQNIKDLNSCWDLYLYLIR